MLSLARHLAGWQGYAVAALLAGLAVGAAAWTVQGWRYGAEIVRIERDQAQALAAAEQAARNEEARRAAAIEEIQRDAQTAVTVAQRDAAAAGAVSERLRAQLARLRADLAAGDPPATLRGPTGADALDLLAELFSRADGHAGELAAIADRARAAGLACERSYDAMRGDR